MAVSKWEKPNTITGLPAFLAFSNYYSGCFRDYAGIVSPMMELLKVGRIEGKKGSTTQVKWSPLAGTVLDSPPPANRGQQQAIR